MGVTEAALWLLITCADSWCAGREGARMILVTEQQCRMTLHMYGTLSKAAGWPRATCISPKGDTYIHSSDIRPELR